MDKKLKHIAFGVLSVLLAACDNTDPEVVDPELELDQSIAALNLEKVPEIVHPADNPYSEKKEDLGQILFWDPIIGGEFDVACVTCHHPDLAYADALDLPIGVRGHGLGPDRVEGEGIDRVPRNSPTILNSAYIGLVSSSQQYDPAAAVMFWDGREEGLEEQAKLPPSSRSEMRGDFKGGAFAIEYIIPRLAEIPEYVSLFQEAFPEDPDPVNVANYARAVSVFQRISVAVSSPYDAYLDGDKTALTKEQKEGLLLFFGKAGCANCHYGPMLSDWEFYALGVPEHPLRLEQKGGPDVGNTDFKDFKFRTPSLRNVALTAPYMHNGMIATLEEVVEFMDHGIAQNQWVQETAENFKPLSLTADEKSKIVAFMHALTDDSFSKEILTEVPSGLNPGGNID
jgi:cytochrome c peroxidase